MAPGPGFEPEAFCVQSAAATPAARRDRTRCPRRTRTFFFPRSERGGRTCQLRGNENWSRPSDLNRCRPAYKAGASPLGQTGISMRRREKRQDTLQCSPAWHSPRYLGVIGGTRIHLRRRHRAPRRLLPPRPHLDDRSGTAPVMPGCSRPPLYFGLRSNWHRREVSIPIGSVLETALLATARRYWLPTQDSNLERRD